MKIKFLSYAEFDDVPEGMAAQLIPETDSEKDLLSPLFKYGKLLIDDRDPKKVRYLIHWSPTGTVIT